MAIPRIRAGHTSWERKNSLAQVLTTAARLGKLDTRRGTERTAPFRPVPVVSAAARDPGKEPRMDNQRFDDLARSLATGVSRRRLLRGLLGGAAAGAVTVARGGVADAQTGLAPGAVCTASGQCSQSGGTTICADNGISTDGALNCCRNTGGTCTSGNGCCGALRCTSGTCQSATTGGLAPGAACTSTTQCSQTGGAVSCADNGISTDGALNCCRVQGGTCTTGSGCCGDLRCVNGVCGGSTAGGLAPGATCTSTSQCSQTGGAVTCADNGIASDGALNCCRGGGGVCTAGNQCCGTFVCADNGISGDGSLNCCNNVGGACANGASCCGSLLCVNGICGGGTSGGGLALGATCTTTSQCSQTGGATICDDNGIVSDGAKNCCRSGGGTCTAGNNCCGTLICADNGIVGDGPLNCCNNVGGSCTTGAGCCYGYECVGGICQ